ncbi:unnamed protein product [Dicrocoelium dendriticum]|nr:unnamed protein product [Dicrocoelium dendriticum]
MLRLRTTTSGYSRARKLQRHSNPCSSVEPDSGGRLSKLLSTDPQLSKKYQKAPVPIVNTEHMWLESASNDEAGRPLSHWEGLTSTFRFEDPIPGTITEKPNDMARPRGCSGNVKVLTPLRNMTLSGFGIGKCCGA